MLSHELRNPLAAIWTAAAIVKSDGRTPEQLEFAVRVIDRQTRHLRRMLDDLLDVGRAMTGKIVLERTPIELSAQAEHVLETLETTGRLSDRNVELEAAPVWGEGDQTRVE